jgi:hypothetical protein
MPRLLHNSFAMVVVLVSHVLAILGVWSAADIKCAWPATPIRPVIGASAAKTKPATSCQRRRRVIAW